MTHIQLFQDNPADRKLWDDFVMRHPDATTDHLWAWRTILQTAFGFRKPFYLCAMENGEIQGILPLFKVPKPFGKSALVSIPFGNYGGICANNAATAEKLFQRACEILKSENAGSLQLSHKKSLPIPGLQQSGPTHGRYVMPLEKDPQIHWKTLGSNTRNKVQRAKKSGLTLSSTSRAESFYSIYVHTARRQGVPCFPFSYFESILKAFGENAKVLLVHYQGKPIAYYLTLYFKNTLFSQFAGSLSDYYKYYPNELLFWTSVEEGIRMGFKEFDFGKSRILSGTAEFKRKLHFTEEPADTQFYLPNKQTSPAAAISRKKRSWASKTWQKLPLKLTESLGPAVLRYFA